MKVVIFLLGVGAGLANTAMKLVLYRWFLVPLGAPDLTFWHAYGVVLLYGLFTIPGYAHIIAAEQHPASEARQIALRLLSMLMHLVSVGLGWLVLFFASPF